MTLPSKRPKQRSGIERAERREFPRHRAFVRRFSCCVRHCEDGPIEFCHVRTAANSGTGLKPHDAFGLSLCHAHHMESHQIGTASFERIYGIDLMGLAMEFASRSTDPIVREFAKTMNENPPTFQPRGKSA